MTARFPNLRLRRLRRHPGIRRLVGEERVTVSDLILPMFVRPGRGERRPVESMPGVDQVSPDVLAEDVAAARELGLGGVILFGVPLVKDAHGSDALSEHGIVAEALRTARPVAGQMPLITDLCFCEYTDHGHCGPLVERGGRSDVDNDATLELLGRQAVVHARAGADVIAPSGMMDGMVAAIRRALDDAQFDHLPILSYAAKYASAFYGPFRDAADSAPQSGDRRGYQMDYRASAAEALREVELDLDEGADMIMVKPALAYLDIVHRVAESFPGVPLAAYNVSGEYSMVKAAAAAGWLDERAVVMESLAAIRRAGANIVVTYWAKDVARWLSEG